MEKFWNFYGQRTYKRGVFIRGIKCFFTEHDIKWGCRENYEPDWCEYCWKNNPYDLPLFKDYLTKIFVWIIGHLPEKQGDKLLSWKPRFIKRMPTWWEY